MPKNQISVNSAYEKMAAISQFSNEAKYNQLLDKNLVTIRDYYLAKNQKEANDSSLPIRIIKVTEDSMELDWSYYNVQLKVEQFKVHWHCWNTDKHDECVLNGDTFTFTIKNLSPGQMYTIRVIAMQDRVRVINKSKYFIIQMNAPPDPPVLRLRYDWMEILCEFELYQQLS
jgi:hypothetical protein